MLTGFAPKIRLATLVKKTKQSELKINTARASVC